MKSHRATNCQQKPGTKIIAFLNELEKIMFTLFKKSKYEVDVRNFPVILWVNQSDKRCDDIFKSIGNSANRKMITSVANFEIWNLEILLRIFKNYHHCWLHWIVSKLQARLFQKLISDWKMNTNEATA